MNKIRLLLIEDNRLLREGIAAILKKHSGIGVISILNANDDLLKKIQSFKPTIVLLDLSLRTQNSLQLVKEVKKDSPATRIIVMDLIPTQADVLEFVQAGVSGFILKDATLDEFLGTIRSVAQGATVLPSLLTGSLFSQIAEHAINGESGRFSNLMKSVRMTKRERQVIDLISDGMTNKEIAQQLNLSSYTVKSHVHNILEKMTLHTRVQIARYAHESEDFGTAVNTVPLTDK